MSALQLIKPPALKPGDAIATVSLSWGGAGKFRHRYEAGKRQLMEAFGVLAEIDGDRQLFSVIENAVV